MAAVQCSDQQSFYQLLKVVGENSFKWRAIVSKEHLGGTKRLKKLFEQRKMRLRPCYRTDCQLICSPGTLRGTKRDNFCSQKIQRESWKEFGCRLDFNYFSANYFGRPLAVYVAKNRVPRTPSRNLQITFYKIRMKSFHDGENTLKIFRIL